MYIYNNAFVQYIRNILDIKPDYVRKTMTFKKKHFIGRDGLDHCATVQWAGFIHIKPPGPVQNDPI